MVLQKIDICASGVKEAEAVRNEMPELVDCNQTSVRCKKCGSPGATIHSEEWSDGLVYVDYSCPACGFSEVME